MTCYALCVTTTNTAPVVSRRRLYDARVRELVCATGNRRLFPELNIPNEVMPHSALDYRTPDEVYFGRAEDLPSNLEVARRTAREARMAINRATYCEACSASMSSPTGLEDAA